MEKHDFLRFFEKFYKKVWKFKKCSYLCNPKRKVRGLIAEIAQLVEHNLAKVRVASSSLVFRSKKVSRNADLNFESHPTGFNYMQVVHYYGRLFFVIRTP